MDLSGSVGIIAFLSIIILALQIGFVFIWCLDRLITILLKNKIVIKQWLHKKRRKQAENVQNDSEEKSN